jgi:hypothetical protein
LRAGTPVWYLLRAMTRERTPSSFDQRSIDDLPPRTPEELGEFLDVSPLTLRQWRWLTRKGVPRGPRWVQVGRHTRYPRPDTQEWLDAGADSPEQARSRTG